MSTLDKRGFNSLVNHFGVLTNNLIINGNFNIWQRGTSFTAVGDGIYTTDRFVWEKSGAGVITITRSTDTPDGLSEFSLKIDVTTVDSSLVAGDFYFIEQRIEGLNTIPLCFGLADARDITISFLVKSPKTGIHSVSFRNSAANRSYITEYTVNAVNTWEKKSVSLTGDITGTWLKDNGMGLRVGWALASGSTFDTTPGTWQAGNFIASINQVNVMDNIANNFHLSRVQVDFAGDDFVDRQHGDELALCQRYFYGFSGSFQLAPPDGDAGSTGRRSTFIFPETMLAATTISNLSGSVTITALSPDKNEFTANATAPSAGAGVTMTAFEADAEL